MSDTELIQILHREFSSLAHNRALDILFSDKQTPEETLNLIEITHGLSHVPIQEMVLQRARCSLQLIH